MSSIQVTIPGDDIQLFGLLYRPQTAKLAPGVIVLHEWHPYDTKAAETVTDVAVALAESGYITLAVAMRGWPDTGGEDDGGERQPYDVVAAVTWLSQQLGVKANQIGVVGFSRGGSIALLSAALSNEFRAVVAFYPVTDIDRWAATTTHEGIRDWYIPEVCAKGAGTKAKSPLYLADRISAATLLIHGDQDQIVPLEQSVLMAEAMQKAGKDVTLHMIHGGVHEGLNQSTWQAISPTVNDFLYRVFET